MNGMICETKKLEHICIRYTLTGR